MISLTLAHESVRIRQDACFFPETTDLLTMVTARRDFAAASLFVRADEPLLLTADETDAFTPRGAWKTLRFELSCDLPGRLCPVGLLPADDGAPVAEVVMNAAVLEAPAHRTQQFFLLLTVAADAAPGLHRGCVRVWQHPVFGPETLLETLDFAVEVHAFVLPARRKMHLDLWQHWTMAARQAEVPLWSDAHFARIEKIMATMGELGVNALTVVASEAPWSGQRLYEREWENVANLFEHSAIGITRDRDGWHYDFSVLDRLVELGTRYGVADEIEVFGLINIWQSPAYGFGQPSDYPDGIRLRYFDAETRAYAYITRAGDVDAYLRALEAHFAQMGWLDRVRVVADEPADLDAFRKSLDRLDAAMPRCRKKAALNHVEFVEEFTRRIGDYVPNIRVTVAKYDALCAVRPLISGRLCWYLACNPSYPNTFLKSDLIESRLLGIITRLLGFDGFLRWAYCCWPEQPRRSVRMGYPMWRSGDFGFVYPSGDGQILKSLRWYGLKRGFDDEELFRALEARGIDTAPFFDRVIREKDPTKWVLESPLPRFYSLDTRDYDAMRRAMLEALEP